MKDVVVIAGGNSERSLLLRDKLANGQYCVRFCQSLMDFRATIDKEKIAAVLLLFPDEFGTVSQMFDGNIMPGIAGGRL